MSKNLDVQVHACNCGLGVRKWRDSAWTQHLGTLNFSSNLTTLLRLQPHNLSTVVWKMSCAKVSVIADEAAKQKVRALAVTRRINWRGAHSYIRFARRIFFVLYSRLPQLSLVTTLLGTVRGTVVNCEDPIYCFCLRFLFVEIFDRDSMSIFAPVVDLSFLTFISVCRSFAWKCISLY